MKKVLILIFMCILFSSQLNFIYSQDEILVNEDLLNENPATFWEMVLDFPQALLDLTINGLRDALTNSRDNFLLAINNDRSVLSNEDVRSVYLEALLEDPQELITSHPEVFGQFLQEEGVDNSGAFDFEVLSFDRDGNNLVIRRNEGQTIAVSLNDLNGGILNLDGSVQLNNGAIVNSGSIIQERGEYRITNGIVEIYGREITGDSFVLGPTNSVENLYVRANLEVSFDDGLGRRNILQRDGQVSFYESGAIGLNGDLRVSTIDDNGVLILQRRIITDLSSIDDEMIIAQNPSQCIEGSFGGCIIDQGSRMEIRARNQGNLQVEIHGLEHVAVRVPLIEDSTQLRLSRFLEEDSRIIYRISQDETTLSGGFPSNLSLLTLNTFHPQLEHSVIDGGNIIGHIFNVEHPTGIELEAHQIIEGLDLSRFSESLQGQLNNANFGSISAGEVSIVVALNSLGLPSDMSFRSELAELLGIEDYRGTASQNTQLLNRLRNEGIQGSQRITIGEQLGQIFELDPNLVGSSSELVIPSLENANFANINFNDPSIVRILNQMGIDSSFAARQQLYRELFGREPPTGDQGFQMNIELRRALGEIHAQTFTSTGTIDVDEDIPSRGGESPLQITGVDGEVRTIIPPETLRQPTRSTTLRPSQVSDPSFDRLTYSLGGIRNRGLAPDLERILQATAEETNTRIRIVSGGQMGFSEMPRGSYQINRGGRWYAPGGRALPRTGSTRHDYGNGADFDIIDATTGRVISYGEPAFFQFLTTLSANGARGVGADRNGRYMNQGSATGRVHADIQSPAVWGHGGSGANTPDPVRRAVSEGERIRSQRCREAGVVCR
ncbi:MAG: DUF3597 domain-containing protein [Nanoarchaeota archaeon]|nr:DUF3597 domain-containing protein [Nanoarchaeota archaeon]